VKIRVTPLIHFFLLTIFLSCQQEAEVDNIQIGQLSITSGSSYDFGYTPLDLEKTTTLTLKNTGNYPIKEIIAPVFNKGSPFDYKGGEGYPGFGGTCAQSLPTESECTVVVSFLPTASKQWGHTMDFQFLNGIDKSTITFQLQGTSGLKPVIEFLEDEDKDFGILESFDTKIKTFKIKNTGKLPILSMSFSLTQIGDIKYFGGSFPGNGGNCGSTLGPGKICTFVLEFSPTTDQSHSSTIQIDYHDFTDTISTSANFTGLSLEVIGKLFFVGTLSEDFGQTVQTTEVIRTIYIKNEGYAKATNISFNFSDPDFTIKDNRCPPEIDQAVQCEIDIAYSPVSLGAITGSVEISYNNSKVVTTSPSIDLTGTGLAVASFTLEDNLVASTPINSYHFGNKGQNSKSLFTLKIINEGGVYARINSIDGLTAPYQVLNTSCGATLSIANSCTVEIEYSPTTLTTHNDSLNISYNNGASDVVTSLSLSGVAQSRAVLAFDGLNIFTPEVHLGQKAIGGSFTSLISIKNIGVQSATNITLPTLSAPLSYTGGGNCPAPPFTLNSGASCQQEITYTPSSIENNVETTHDFNYFDSIDAQSLTLTITKSADTVAKIIYSLDSDTDLVEQDFGKVSNGNTKILSVTLSNTGGFSASNLNYVFSNADFSFNDDWPTTGPKGEVGDCPEDGSSFSGGLTCVVYIKYTPSSLGAVTESLTISYNNELIDTNYSLVLKGEGANIAHLDYTPNDSLSSILMDDAAFPGGSSSQTITLTNNGQASATSLSISNIVGSFSTGGATDCGPTLVSGASCTLELDFTPSNIGLVGSIPRINYHNADKSISDALTVEAKGVSPALYKIVFPVVTPYDFEDAEVNKTKTLNITLQNSGGHQASFNSITVTNPIFSIITNGCSGIINSLGTCSLQLGLTPGDPQIGQTVISDVTVNYTDGVLSKDFTFSVTGDGTPPKSTHGGWVSINANGNTVNVSSLSYNDKAVTLSWADMTPTQAYPIDSYNIYRKLPEAEEFDITTPLATGVSSATKTYTDSSVEMGQRYIYQVLPVISGGVSLVDDNYASVEVFVPPQNRSFIHRRIANKHICLAMGKALNKDEFNNCSYLGPAKDENDKFDIGNHLLYDRYELGVNGHPNPGQLPKTTFSQTALDIQCKTNSLLIDDVFVDMRVPSRMEYNIASAWPPSTDIDVVENGFIHENTCNTSAANVEDVGNNSSCISHFGIYNLVGNSWEFTSDRLSNAAGVTTDESKLYPENDHMDTLDFSTIATSSVDTTDCTSVVLGHPVPKVSGSCPEGSKVSSALGIVEDNFWNPSSFSASFAVPLVGGSYENATFAGRYTTAWVPTSYPGGGRCVYSLPTGEKFPAP